MLFKIAEFLFFKNSQFGRGTEKQNRNFLKRYCADCGGHERKN